MTAINSYSTGTVSVTNGDTVIVGNSTIWSGVNARPGDRIIIDGLPDLAIKDVTDPTHLTLWAPWSGGDKSGVSYTIIQESPQRFAGATAMASVDAMTRALNTDGFYWFVAPDLSEPDPSYGEEDQFALQTSTGKLWLKTGGVWVFQGIYKGFSIKGPWSSATAYQIGDVVSLAGTSYVALAPSTNQTPPNATYWMVLAAKGDPGADGTDGTDGTDATISVGTTTTGAPGTNADVTNSGTPSAAVLDFTIPAGKGYGGSSTTSLAIGTGSKTLAIGTGYAYQVGNYVRISSATNGTNFMEGPITAYSGGNITVNVVYFEGSGTHADWSFSISGARGSTTGTSIGSIQGLTTSNNATDPNNDIDVSVGVARDTANAFDLALPIGITKRLDAAWAAGTNQGGLDTGAKAASTSYHIFIIRKTADGTCDVLFSTSPTNPVMPSGYGAKRRIAIIKTDAGGNIKPYVQAGGYFTLKAPAQQLINSPGIIQLVTADDLPIGVKLRANLLVATGASNFTASGYVMVRDPDLGVPSVINSSTGVLFQYEAQTFAVPADVWSNAAGQFYCGSAVQTGPVMFFVVKGWFDLRDQYQ